MRDFGGQNNNVDGRFLGAVEGEGIRSSPVPPLGALIVAAGVMLIGLGDTVKAGRRVAQNHPTGCPCRAHFLEELAFTAKTHFG
jgi:hypothetical protein